MTNYKSPNSVEKRFSKRITPPNGTEAILNGMGFSSDQVEVKDISLGGMMFCGEDTVEGFSQILFIDDICINIPIRDIYIDQKQHLFMGKGKVVRCITDESSTSKCYAIKFDYNSSYLAERLKATLERISSGS